LYNSVNSVAGRGKSAKFSSDDFGRRLIVLKKYADTSKDLHLEILYAFQSGVHKLEHPPHLLYNIFNTLYDLEIVDEPTFIEWRDRGKEGSGKGVAVHSVTDFFQWLENANQESDLES
jgi:hypothetical protein